ncbi:MAG: DNA alkylation repair protein [Lachnospiraceae bacterium]
MRQDHLQKQLFNLQDITYRDFHAKLIPTVDATTIIGVRTPVLRKFAKEFSQTSQAEEFMEHLPHSYYEENNLHCILIEMIKDYPQSIVALDTFLPYVDNWATCDLMRPPVFKKHLQELICKIKEWINSDYTYTIRFGIKMLMCFYLDDHFQESYLTLVANISSQEYYVKMMIAWYFATALAKQYNTTLPYIEQQRLDNWTHNKTIQKAIESYRITGEQKTYLRTLKIKS